VFCGRAGLDEATPHLFVNFHPQFSAVTVMNTKLHLFASALALALFADSSQASTFFCNNYVASSPPPHYQCEQTEVGPGAPLVVSPDQAGSGLRVGESFSTGSGPFASAQMLGGSIPTAYAVANSDA
jgi:hypothetical protein